MKIGQTQPTAKDRDDRPGFTGVHPATGSGDDHASNDSESDHGLVKVPAPGDGGPHANEIRNAKAAAKANKLRDTTAEVVLRHLHTADIRALPLDRPDRLRATEQVGSALDQGPDRGGDAPAFAHDGLRATPRDRPCRLDADGQVGDALAWDVLSHLV